MMIIIHNLGLIQSKPRHDPRSRESDRLIWHRVRIASKRLRYAIEFSEGTLSKEDFSAWRATMKHLRKAQQVLGELNDAEIRRSLAVSLEGSQSTSTPDPDDLKPIGRKQKSRLLRRAAIVYRKIAG
jgi:CHAD domain-containing protein